MPGGHRDRDAISSVGPDRVGPVPLQEYLAAGQEHLDLLVVAPAAAGRSVVEERNGDLAFRQKDDASVVGADLALADLVLDVPAGERLPDGALLRLIQPRATEGAGESIPCSASSFRPSRVAAAAPLVTSTKQCGETKAILRLVRFMVVSFVAAIQPA